MYMLILILQQQIEVKSIPRNFFLGFYYGDLLSVMLSEVVFNYNFVFFSKIYIYLNTRKITGVFNFMHIYFSIQI